VQSEFVPPAMIFTGPSGTGKLTVAKAFAYVISCEVKRGCGKCNACRENRFGAGTRLLDISEYFESISEKNKTALFRRELSSHSLSHTTKYFIVIIDNADQMSDTMQAVLLKSIEEPIKGLSYILITKSLLALSSTIRSRSLIIRFKPLDINSLCEIIKIKTGKDLTFGQKEMLSLANGSVSKALEILNNNLTFTKEVDEFIFKTSFKSDRISFLKKLEALLPFIITKYPEAKEDLINFDRAVFNKAYIPLASEVFRRSVTRKKFRVK